MTRAAALPHLLSERELCAVLDVTRPTLLRYRQREGLPYVRTGSRTIRYDPRDVEAWLKARRVRHHASK